MSVRLKDTIYDLVNKSDWNNLINKPTFATVATSGKYSDLSGTPTFYTLTFSSGTFSSGSFVANSSNKTINIPTTTSHISEGTNLYFTDARAQSAITGGASTIASSNLTASRALISNSSGKVAVSAVTSTELGYLDGVTSAIQTQLNAKLASSSYTASDVLTKLKTVDGSDSGLDADLLDGKHDGEVTAKYLHGQYITNANNANNINTDMILYSQIPSTSENIPSYTGYQNAILSIGLHTVGSTAQLYFSANQPLYYRSNYDKPWNQIAYITDNVSSASKLNTARKISISGAVTGNASFDGSSDITISTSVNHTHNYAGSSSAGGSATSALKLATARTISLTGSVTGSGSFDGSGNLSIATTTNHNHDGVYLKDASSLTCGGSVGSNLNNYFLQNRLCFQNTVDPSTANIPSGATSSWQNGILSISLHVESDATAQFYMSRGHRLYYRSEKNGGAWNAIAYTSDFHNYLYNAGNPSDLNSPSTWSDDGARLVFDNYNGNASNKPVSYDNANSLITLFKTKHSTSGQYASQLAFPDDGRIYYRISRGGSWLGWSTIAFTSDVSGGSVSGSYLPLAGGNMTRGARIGASEGNLYLGNASNAGWILTQDICSHSAAGDSYWSLRTNGTAHFQTLYLGGEQITFTT